MNLNIVNSKGFWEFGWVRHPEAQSRIVNVLEKSGFQVNVFEVDNAIKLNQLMERINPDDLVWTNAYHIYADNETNRQLWLNELMEKRGFKIIGSNSQTLSHVLHKEVCQQILKDHKVSIPSFVSVSNQNLSSIDQLIKEQQITFPAIVKPSATAGSMGIHVVNSIDEARIIAQKVIADHAAKAIIESFLQGPDITVGILYDGNEYYFMPTYYEKLGVPAGQNYVMERSVRLAPWTNRRLRLVTDEKILKVIHETVPKAFEALNIRDITRMDGRLNDAGEFCIFDVNGLPGLGGPEGVTAKQSNAVFPQITEDESFELLINTIVYCAAKRNRVGVPSKIEEHNFFALS